MTHLEGKIKRELKETRTALHEVRTMRAENERKLKQVNRMLARVKKMEGVEAKEARMNA